MSSSPLRGPSPVERCVTPFLARLASASPQDRADSYGFGSRAFGALMMAAVALAACSGGSSRAPAPTTPTTTPTASASEAAERSVRVTVTIDPKVELAAPPKGKFVTAWLSRAEYEAVKSDGPSAKLAYELLTSRISAWGDVDLTATKTVVREVKAPAGDVVLWGWLDVCGEFMRTAFGSDGCVGSLDGFAEHLPSAAATGNAELVFSHATRPSSTERCVGDRKRLVLVPEPAVGNAASKNRRLCVHLPRSYATATDRRYPVVYVLSGLMGTDTTRLVGGHVDEIGDEIMNTPGRDAILVGVDTSTRAGSTYLVDTQTGGAFDTFFSKTMVTAIDQAFRTVADPRARALMGQSTGGFNAVSAALRHTDVFTVIGSMSPDALDFASWFLAPGGETVATPWLRWMQIENSLAGGGQMISYASEWSPDPAAPRGLAWPADLKTGKLNRAVWAKWLAESPAELLKRPAIATGVRTQLNPNRIYITVASGDEFGLYAPAARFSEALRSMGIEHTFVATEGGHFDGMRDRQVATLRHCLSALATSAKTN